MGKAPCLSLSLSLSLSLYIYTIVREVSYLKFGLGA